MHERDVACLANNHLDTMCVERQALVDTLQGEVDKASSGLEDMRGTIERLEHEKVNLKEAEGQTAEEIDNLRKLCVQQEHALESTEANPHAAYHATRDTTVPAAMGVQRPRSANRATHDATIPATAAVERQHAAYPATHDTAVPAT
eukprot:6465198-Amphidinium_carterae.1